MKIATPDFPEDLPFVRSANLDGRVTLKDFTRAERLHRQIIAAMEECETVAIVAAYYEAEIDIRAALASDQPELSAAVDAAFTEIRDRLAYCEARFAAKIPGPLAANGERPANHGNSAIETPKGTEMFKIATHEGGGSQGPWMSWSSNGSAMKSIAPKSWVLRDKDANSQTVETVIPAFANGCVMDLDSLKLGWEKDGGQGQAPERRWSPDVSMPMPRPDDSQKAQGGYAWSPALTVRCAIGGGKAATWEQGAFGAYEGFTRLARQIEAQYPGDGTLPLVKMTGVETIKLKSGSANIPILVIEKWVPRPDCLKADAPTIATQPASASAPQPAPQPAPEPESDLVPDEIKF